MSNQPKLVFDSDPREPKSGCVRVHNLQPDMVSLLHARVKAGTQLQPILRVKVVEPEAGKDELPDVFGRYRILENGLQFTPYFPFERDVKYRAVFDPRPLSAPIQVGPFDLQFLIRSEQTAVSPTEVTHVFPSCEQLPENLLRFYVCFSNSMQRGRALEEISLLDSYGQPVADALYRAPVELWDRTMRCLTVLLDPGRLKRWVGPNVALGPPLKAGQKYTLQIGSGMIDLYGRPIGKTFRKHFVVGDSVREPIAVESWNAMFPASGSREALVLRFANPLDWAVLLRSITIVFADGSVIDGRVAIDQSERRWSFTPSSPWNAGVYQVHVDCGLEDVCGNRITSAFDRPLRKYPNAEPETNSSSLTFELL